jgi:hypothetical protein
MNREEAIYYLKASGMSDEQIKSVIDAFTCDDCISREAVEEITWEEPSYTDALNAITEIRDKIRQLPSVTPQPKIGKWIDDGWYAEGHSEHAYRCSKCDKNYIGYVGEHKYCPNCGAKMEVEE